MKRIALALLCVMAMSPALAEDAAPAPHKEAAQPATTNKAPTAGKEAARPADAKDAKDAKEQPAAPADANKAAKDSTATPQRFVPSEQVRSDFDVSFPVDI